MKVGDVVYYIESKHGIELSWNNCLETKIIEVTSKSIVVEAFKYLKINKKTMYVSPSQNSNYPILFFQYKQDYEFRKEALQTAHSLKSYFNKLKIFDENYKVTVKMASKLSKIAKIIDDYLIEVENDI